MNPSAILRMRGAVAGGGMGAGPTVRGNSLATFSATGTPNVTLPIGTVAGDLAVLFTAADNWPTLVACAEDNFTSDYTTTFTFSGGVFHKRLTGLDVSRGFITPHYNASTSGIVGLVVFPDSSVYGAEQLTGTPVVSSGVTWSSGTATCSSASSIVRWTGVLTAGTQYWASFNINMTSGAALRIGNGSSNGSEIVYTTPGTLATGTSTVAVLFTAVDSFFSIEASGATFSGTISSISCKPVTSISPAFRTTASASNDSSPPSTQTATTDSSPQIGDYALMSGLTANNHTVTITGNPGTALQSVSSATYSGVSRLGILTAAGSFSEVLNFSGTPNAEFSAIIVISP